MSEIIKVGFLKSRRRKRVTLFIALLFVLAVLIKLGISASPRDYLSKVIVSVPRTLASQQSLSNGDSVQVLCKKGSDGNSYSYILKRITRRGSIESSKTICISNRVIEFDLCAEYEDGAILVGATAIFDASVSNTGLRISLGDKFVEDRTSYWLPVENGTSSVLLALIDAEGSIIESQWGNYCGSVPVGSGDCIRWGRIREMLNYPVIETSSRLIDPDTDPYTSLVWHESTNGLTRLLFTVEGGVVDFVFPLPDGKIVLVGRYLGSGNLRVDQKTVRPIDEGSLTRPLNVRIFGAEWDPENGIEWLTLLEPDGVLSDCRYAASWDKAGDIQIATGFRNAEVGGKNIGWLHTLPTTKPLILDIRIIGGEIASVERIGYGCVSFEFAATIHGKGVFCGSASNAEFLELNGELTDRHGRVCAQVVQGVE